MTLAIGVSDHAQDPQRSPRSVGHFFYREQGTKERTGCGEVGWTHGGGSDHTADQEVSLFSEAVNTKGLYAGSGGGWVKVYGAGGRREA